MGTISVSYPADGTTADVADYNNPIATIVTAINGNLDQNNLANNAVSTGKIADDAVTAAKINWAATGANGGIWWEEVGRTTLASAADSITVSSIARKYLKIYVSVRATGGTISPDVTFNGDTGSNYADRSSGNGAGDGTATSQSRIRMYPAVSENQFAILEFTNVAAIAKIVRYEIVTEGSSGAGNAPGRSEGAGKWANTSAQVSSITVTNGAGTGDFAIGSEIIVLGHD